MWETQANIDSHLPPVPSPSSLRLIVRNSAPIDSTCSFTAARVSKARTIAPII